MHDISERKTIWPHCRQVQHEVYKNVPFLGRLELLTFSFRWNLHVFIGILITICLTPGWPLWFAAQGHQENISLNFIALNSSRKPLTSLQPICVLQMLMMTKMRLVEWKSNSNWVLCPFHKNGPAVIWTDRVGCKKSFKKGNCREENWWTHVEF